MREGLEDMVKKEYKEVKMKTALVLPDMHVPYHDERALQLVYKYIQYKKPNVIIQLGDFYDMYSLSKYDKDPSRIDSLQEEIDVGSQIWKNFKKLSPKSKLIMLEGNHERRLHKYLMKNPEMHSLNALKIENLLGLKELGVEFYHSEQTYHINKNLVVTHGAVDDGCKLSQHSGYSAKNTLDKWGNISGIMGHGHRVGMSNRTLSDGSVIQWVEAGHLCDPHPSYVKNPNWQQGIVLVNYTNNRFHITPATIVDYKFILDGKLWQG